MKPLRNRKTANKSDLRVSQIEFTLASNPNSLDRSSTGIKEDGDFGACQSEVSRLSAKLAVAIMFSGSCLVH